MSNLTTNDCQQQQLQEQQHYSANFSLQNNDNNNGFEVISSDNLMNHSVITTEAVHIITANTSYINHVTNDNDNVNNCNDGGDDDNDDDDVDDDNVDNAAATATLNFINATVMNDIFSQDEVNFVEPTIVSNNKSWSSAINDNDSATLTSHIFNTPNSLCIKSTSSTVGVAAGVANNNFDDEATHWHGSSDLLELDHRYNSCLQAELLQNESTSVIMNSVDGETISDLSDYIELKSKPLSVVSEAHEHFSNRLSPPQSKSNTHNDMHVPIVMEQQQHQQQQQLELEQNQQILRVNSDSESDFEDRNLSWLLNFKFDELPHLSPDTAALNSKSKINLNLTNLNIQSLSKNLKKGTACQSSIDFSLPMPNANMQNLNHNNNSDGCSSPMKAGKKFEELVMEATSEMDCNDNTTQTEGVVIDDMSFRMGKKPPFTYTELIEYALEDKGELTVSGIYQWISDRFPYYKSNDDRWKNSVRHNLSINPHFRKGAKASQGAGHLWTISSGDSAESALAWEHKKQRLELFFKMESANIKRIQQHKLKHQKYEKEQQQQQQKQQLQQCSASLNIMTQHENTFDDEAAAAADIITREMIQQQQQPNDGNHHHHTHCHVLNDHNMGNIGGTITTSTTTAAEATTTSTTTPNFVQELPFNDLICEEELRRAAGQILNGIHREVEVQSVNEHVNNYQNVLLENDYLCESVLQHSTNFNSTIGSNYGSATNQQNLNNISSQFNITELDPMELGIQMSHHVDNEEILFNDELGLNFFGYNVNSDIAT